MKYVIYKTTNLINGKIYIGFHRTDNLDDGYLGSGKLLKRAIEKYSLNNFKREILYIFDSAEEMFDKEAELVNEDFISRSDTYNLKVGGNGGWDHITITANHKKKISKSLESWPTRFKPSQKMLTTAAKNFKKAHRDGKIRYNTFLGKHHTEEAKRKIGQANSKHQQGSGNSNFGRCWIYSNEEKRSMKISKDDLQEWIDRGWIKGRKMKF